MKLLSKKYFEQRGAIQGALSLVFFLALAVLVVLYMFGTVVPPGTMGVRQIKFGPGQGFSTKGLPSGYHWSVPGYSTVHIVPRTLQLIHFNREGMQTGDLTTFDVLEVQSADRATVDIDASILYRFYDAPALDAGKIAHGGPADLFRLGTARESWLNEVRRRAEDQIKRNLGKLQTARFYQPEYREPLIEEARSNMNEALASSGIFVESILLRRFTYREDRIDNAIFQKNLQEQEERRNLAQSKFVEVEGGVKKIEAEKSAENETIKVQAESNARVIRSQGDLYESEKKAAGDLLVARSVAEVDRLKSEALAKSQGAAAYVGREVVPFLSSLKGGVVSDLDPYDLDAWGKKLGVAGGAK